MKLKSHRAFVLISTFLLLLLFGFLLVLWIFGFEFPWPTKKKPSYSKEHYENLKFQLKNIHCPARHGLQLRDYWECLWRTSITKKGRLEHQRILAELYLEQMEFEAEELRARANMTIRNKKLVRRVRQQLKSRKRRQTVTLQFNESDPRLHYTYQKVLANILDLEDGLNTSTLRCQQEILPGKSILNFLRCIRQGNYSKGRGPSFHATFQPTEFPKLKPSDYSSPKYEVPKFKHKKRDKEYTLSFDFQPLSDEENPYNFFGADPYLESDHSPYRYKFNAQNLPQRQVAWSYVGVNGAKRWHSLEVERFYLPLRHDVGVAHAEFDSELPQTFPGLGSIEEQFGQSVPMDPHWTKDSGYNAYTRYLLPLILDSDLEYYKKKNLIDESVTRIPDVLAFKDILDNVDVFQNATKDTLFAGNTPNPLFPKMEDVPFYKSYLEFIDYMLGVNVAYWLTIKNSIINATTPKENVTFWEFENVRKLLHKYTEAVRVQESCLREMLKTSPSKFEDPNQPEALELFEKMEHVSNTSGCELAADFAAAITTPVGEKPRFKFNKKNLQFIFDAYFERRNARERYTLHRYPIPFPICKNNEPSPIDIITKRSRESYMRDYRFGRSAYMLQRFFMFFPVDGSPLLTVGIVDGERLDESSVRLFGGAVKENNLTFQYMHISFARDWQRVGSEHWIDGRGSQMELQMIFTISGSADPIKYWQVLARVQNKLFQFREKLVVILSVLVDVLATDEEVKDKIEKEKLNQDPYVFEPLAQAAYQFRKMPLQYPELEQPRGYVSMDPAFRLIDFIPKVPSKYYTYRGSLSWPPCFGYVIRSVYEQRLYMSKRQFLEFTKIPAYGIQDSSYAHDNFRAFDDIYVEEETDDRLTLKETETMKRLRTTDRMVLRGHHVGHREQAHDHHDDEKELTKAAVLGDELYHMSHDNSATITCILWLNIFSISISLRVMKMLC